MQVQQALHAAVARIHQLEGAFAQQHQAAAPQGRPLNIVKVSPFFFDGKEDWLCWRRHFNRVCEANEWNEATSMSVLSSSIRGRAATTTMDIDDAGILHLPDLLDAYEERFLPVAASQIAESRFEAAKQSTKESISDWHARLRAIWMRAYPNEDPGRQMIRKFNLGILHTGIQHQAIRANAQTYQEALEAAQNELSVVMVTHLNRTGEGKANLGLEPMDISSISAIEAESDCHHCNLKGHYKRNCPSLSQVEKMKLQPKAGRKGRGRRPEGADKKATPKLSTRQMLAQLMATMTEEEDTVTSETTETAILEITETSDPEPESDTEEEVTDFC